MRVVESLTFFFQTTPTLNLYCWTLVAIELGSLSFFFHISNLTDFSLKSKTKKTLFLLNWFKVNLKIAVMH